MTVVARWEWRTFGDDFGDADRHLAALTPRAVEHSRDLYVLSAGSDASVKVRDGLLDVKHLVELAEDGLERWLPVLKAPMPVGRREVAVVLETLAVAAPELERSAYGLDELLDEVVRPAPELRVVEVRKRRVRYVVGGCMAERSELTTDAGGRWTVAIESEDADRVRAAVGQLGLQERPVVCVARGLKAILDYGARRYAVIDVGTNSVKFHLRERGADGAWTTVADRAEVTRLGQDLESTGRLGWAAIDRTVDAIAEMAAEARRSGAEEIAAVGTAALRLAPNAAQLVEAARARCGVRVEVISAEEETRLAQRATTAGLPLPPGPLVVFDTGGGSFQFTFGHGRRVDERFSVDVGAVGCTERHALWHAVPPEQLDAALTAIAADLGALRGRPAPDLVVGMGGAVTNLAAVAHGLARYDPDVVHGTLLGRAEIERQIELYRTRDADGRRAIAGLQPNRAEVILAGACIVRTVLELLGRDALLVSDRGLRHGLLVERFGAPPPRVATAPGALAATPAAGP